MAQNNVLQYVGARYVPVFYNNPNGTWEWLSGVQYEPLTIVKYGTQTYTSKQLVPATVGAPNSAPEYWALTGDYNGAIVDIQNDIIQIQEDMENPKFFFGNRIFLIIGDSYAAEDDGIYQKWPSFTKYALGVSDENWINVAVSGSGFLGYGEGTKFILQLQSPTAMAKRLEITDIVIVGGLNDSVGTPSSIADEMNSFNHFLVSNYPKATVWLGYVGSYTTKSTVIANRTIDNILQAEAIYQSQGRALGWNVVSNLRKSWTFGDIFYYEGNYNDWAHPSFNSWSSGAAYIARSLANVIKGCPVICSEAPRNWIGGNYYYYTESSLELYGQTGFISFTPNVPINDPAVSIGNINFTTFLKPYVYVGAALVVRNSGTTVEQAVITFNGTDITCRFVGIPSTEVVTNLYIGNLSIPRMHVS